MSGANSMGEVDTTGASSEAPPGAPQATKGTEAAEVARLRAAENADGQGWRRWGPYVGERAWGTVREDYSADGDAWDYLPHDLARSKAYRWGEDGIAGICDRYQLLVLRPGLLERPRPDPQGAALRPDARTRATTARTSRSTTSTSTTRPTHSYMKFLYKYPQAEFPYGRLVEENRRRGGQGREFELLDTGVFDERPLLRHRHRVRQGDAGGPRASASRRSTAGPEPAPLHILPHLWFRNTWAWSADAAAASRRSRSGPPGPDFVSLRGRRLRRSSRCSNLPVEYRLGPRAPVRPPRAATPLFTDNETNMPPRLRPRQRRAASRYVKDAFHRHVVHGEPCVNPDQVGTKAALHYRFDAVPPGGSVVAAAAADRRRRPDAPAGRRRRDRRQRRRPRPTSSTRRIHPPKATEDERLRPAAGAGRPALDQAELPLRRRRLARRRQPRLAAARRRG